MVQNAAEESYIPIVCSGDSRSSLVASLMGAQQLLNNLFFSQSLADIGLVIFPSAEGRVRRYG